MDYAKMFAALTGLLTKSKIVSLMIIALCVVSCRTYKPQVITTNDSISVKEIVRDSIITIPPDSAWLKAWLECDSSGNVLLQQLEQRNGEKIKATYTLERDTSGATILYLSSVIEAQRLELELKEKEIARLKTNTVLVEAPIPPFKRFLMWTGGIALIFVGAYIFIKLR